MTRAVLLAGAMLALSLPASATAAKRQDTRPKPSVPVEFPFEPRGVFRIVTAPGRITDIALEPGERLVETNPIAAGDTARWMIGDTTSGEGTTRRVHVLVKPTLATLATNLVINTDRRTYFLDIEASTHAYLTQVSWRYADVPKPIPVVTAPIAPSRKVVHENYGYAVKGPRTLRPKAIFDDGSQVVLVFGDRLDLNDLPPLYRVGPGGNISELINYRVEGRSLVVDRLFDVVELRYGAKRWAKRVRITRLATSVEAGR